MVIINLIKKYKPKTKEDFVGNEEILEKSIDHISKGIHVLVTGNTGVGKTCMGYLIANILNLNVVEVNASTELKKEPLDRIFESMKTRSIFGKSLFIFDEIESFKNVEKLYQTLKKTHHPVYITANDSYKIPYKIKKFCKYYNMVDPKLGQVVRRIKQIARQEKIPNEKVNFKNITSDIRSSIISCFDNSGKKTEEESPFTLVRDAFRDGKQVDIHPAWLMDNVHNFYHGIEVYEALEIIKQAIVLDDNYLYTCLPKSTYGGKVNYPYYFRRK